MIEDMGGGMRGCGGSWVSRFSLRVRFTLECQNIGFQPLDVQE